MNTRLTTAAVAVLVSTIALGACGTTSVDDAEPQAPAVNSIGYGTYAPRGPAPAPTKVPAYTRSASPDGGHNHPSTAQTGNNLCRLVVNGIDAPALTDCDTPAKDLESGGDGGADRIRRFE